MHASYIPIIIHAITTNQICNIVPNLIESSVGRMMVFDRRLVDSVAEGRVSTQFTIANLELLFLSLSSK